MEIHDWKHALQCIVIAGLTVGMVIALVCALPAMWRGDRDA